MPLYIASNDFFFFKREGLSIEISSQELGNSNSQYKVSVF